eukprot:CAMPEP_0197516264 /NCGR_PEP_ID=MMETSP1318-20131121/1121_1 /TAXON_ID=552666 /ORGANISM="Partenskyella glossopodia, Strain RCC365" /LENGTH=321 /DNA_ID=CAMNT_0043064853 /DNA_START=133 /DNA_END=1095 /DNA_ORIENTATION=-
MDTDAKITQKQRAITWPPVDDAPSDLSNLTCPMKATFFNTDPNMQKRGDRVVEFRNNYIEKWYTQSCEQWKFEGTWTKREDRKIYYAFAFGGELEVLTLVLEEIYPAVDYIIIVEANQTWRGEPKPLFFNEWKDSHFYKYMDKIRYLPYGFDDDEIGARIDRCMDEDPAGVYGKGELTCRWMRQWGARDWAAKEGAKDITDNDVFIISDLDELLAREFLYAVKHCNIWPEPDHPDKCSRMGIHVFGHRYHFGCTVAKNFGHFHPDMVLGRCLPLYGGEEVRREFDKQKKYRPRPPDLLKTKYVGPGGWHMHSFLSTAQVAW